ncbi:MAG: type III secretion protein [Pseudonocardiales bacterium]|nr:MAG: type III secretion protein [Pseudonocardiales bacterium]
MSGSQEKTEKPTAKRLKDGRKEGQIARTPELGAWIGILAATVLIPLVIRSSFARTQALLLEIGTVIRDPEPSRCLSVLGQGMRDVVIAVAPLALGLMAIGVAALVAQGGVHPSGKLLKPKLSRLNPLAGLKRTFGPHSLWETIKSVVRVGVLGLVAYHYVRGMADTLMASGPAPLMTLLGTAGSTVMSIIRSSALVGIIMAAADYMVVRKRTSKQLRMTKHQVKEEHKQTEGDPQLRGAIRSRQMAMSRNRMMADLVDADVVVVNPTHVAVALRYDPDRGAPRVVAKGAGTLAARIREIAAEHRIALVQDVPLARALHAGCELGQEVPPELYAAVARVLAFVMALKSRGSAAGLHRPAVPGAAA